MGVRPPEQSPLGARVVAVCDAYAAMVSERPYSVAMRPSRALEELRRSASSQFDPKVVAAFEQVAAQHCLPGDATRAVSKASQ